ncbi:MAG: choice-of-anchor V domain-containing protein [Bacteroidia bacterium]
MIKKITFSFAIVTLICIVMFSYNNKVHSNSSGAPAGKTGSPGDGSSCNSCHSTSGTPATGAILITSNVPTGGYISGNTYSITVRAAHSTFNKFGFQISPQAANGTLLGTLAITNVNETQLVGSGKYVTHKAAGTTGTNIPMIGNFKEWSFNWTAPAPGTGAVTFYGAALLANSNNQNTGDSLVLGTLVINESSTNGIDKNIIEKGVAVYPNPAKEILYLQINELAEVEIIDVSGKSMLKQQINNGINSFDISGLNSGLYFVKITGKENKLIKKFVKE